MSVGSDTADQMVRESIQVTESAVKLAALGAKNLAAMLLAVSKELHQTKGKTSLSAMLAEGRPLKVVRVKLDDLKEFGSECKHYGVLYTAVRDKKATDGLCDVLVRADDAYKINRIMERMGYVTPKEEQEKNGPSREVSAPKSNERSISRAPATSMTAGEQPQPMADKLAGLRMAAKSAKSTKAQSGRER